MKLAPKLASSSELHLELNRFASNAKSNDQACARALLDRDDTCPDVATKTWVLQLLAFSEYQGGCLKLAFIPLQWLKAMGGEEFPVGDGTGRTVVPKRYVDWQKRFPSIVIGLAAADQRGRRFREKTSRSVESTESLAPTLEAS